MILFTQPALHEQPSAPRMAAPARRPGSADRRRARGLPSRFTYLNFDRISDHGVELSADVQRDDAGRSMFANYTWQADPKPTGFDISELNLPPTHRLTRERASLAGGISAVSRAASSTPRSGRTAPGYEGPDRGVHLGGRGRWCPLDRRHDDRRRPRNQPPEPAVQQHVFGDVIRRTVIGEVRFEF